MLLDATRQILRNIVSQSAPTISCDVHKRIVDDETDTSKLDSEDDWDPPGILGWHLGGMGMSRDGMRWVRNWMPMVRAVMAKIAQGITGNVYYFWGGTI